MKIGIMGGTFDPVHIGHLLLGEFAFEQFDLDEIWFLPNSNPPHKNTGTKGTEFTHRANMIAAAIKDVPHFKLSYHEETPGYHYTYKTLLEFRELYPDHDYYFILGADSLFSIETWKYFREIFPSCTILAAMRDDKDTDDMKRQISYLTKHYNAHIELLRAPLLEISSTTIRERVNAGLTVKYMIPEKVEEYIKENNLYKLGGCNLCQNSNQ